MQQDNSQPVQYQQSPSYPQNQPAQNAPQNPVQNTQASLPPQPPKSSKKFIKIILAIIAVFFVIIIAVVAIRAITNRAGRAIDDNKPVEIVWWGLWENSTIVQPLIAKYQEENPNVTIKYERQAPDDYRERLANALARGNGPDIFRMHNTWVPMFKSELSVLPDDIMSQQEYEETFYRVALESALTSDGIKAIPLEFDGLGLFINEDILNSFALTTPDSWEDVRDAASTIKIEDFQSEALAQAGIALGLTDNIDNWEEIIGLLFIQNRVNLAEPSGVKFADALSFFRQFESDYRVWDTAQPEALAAFIDGRLGMMIGNASDAFTIREEQPGLRFKVVQVPQLPKFNEDDPDITYASFWMEGVSTRSEAQRQSWKFLEFLTQEENLKTLYSNALAASDVHPGLYPRQDMRSLLLADKYVGGIIKNAPNARFWYLASDTNDGATGINTQLADVLRVALFERSPDRGDFGLQIRAILAQYGLATLPPPVE